MSERFEFPVSPLFTWVKGSIEVDNKVTRLETRNTVFGIIPAGANRLTIPMSNVSSVSVRTGVLVSYIIGGLIAVIMGFSAFSGISDVGFWVFFVGLVLVLFGLSAMVAGVPVYLDIETGGTTRTIFVPFFAKSAVQAAADAMNKALLNTEDRRDVSAAADKVVDAINKK